MKIDKTYQLPFSPERVYAAWVSSDTVIAPATRMDIDPVVGGHYRLFMDTPEFSTRNEGVFLEVEPPAHLKYTWEWDSDGKVTEITVDFSPDGNGCRVRIQHAGFAEKESFEMHATGWDSYISGLIEFLTD